jgi:hypothetical protein
VTCVTNGTCWLRLAGALRCISGQDRVDSYLTHHQNTPSDQPKCRSVVLTPIPVITKGFYREYRTTPQNYISTLGRFSARQSTH